MGASHDHGHGTEHADRRRLGLAFTITFAIVAIQAVGAWTTGSLALLTDTAHALTDSLGLLTALIAATLVLKPADARRTWGFRRVEVIAALGQAVLLIAVGCYVAVEAVSRLFSPPEIPGPQLLIFGVLGLVANILAISILASGRKNNLNMRAAFLEVINDALGSLGVIIAAVLIWTTGFQQADALAGIFIAALIVPRAYRLVRETLAVLMEFTPKGLDLSEVREHLLRLEHVKEVHDLHASTVATGLPVISAHVVVAEDCFRDGCALRVLQEMQQCVAEHFPVSIEHSTFQLETESFRNGEVPVRAHP